MEPIYFNVPPVIGNEINYIEEAIKSKKLSGDGSFTKKCSELIEMRYKLRKALLTPSCTHALEMSALLTAIKPGDEVIMPSYTFVSTANAFALRGAKIIFVDIRPDTMNIDEGSIEDAITDKTKAIVVVHYAGVGCEMSAIRDIARHYHLKLIEDAAQGVHAYYKGQALGSFGDYGCYSFHETKNYSMGEGGALLIKNEEDILQAEIIREKGTNRSQFFRGQIDKYTWIDIGSSYLPSEINVAYLYAQLMQADKILESRMESWLYYHQELKGLEEKGRLLRPYVPEHCKHNAHMYYIKVRDLEERSALIEYLKQRDIQAVFHYIPLHSSPAGKRWGEFRGEDTYTTKESERLLRLPMYYKLKREDQAVILQTLEDFFNER